MGVWKEYLRNEILHYFSSPQKQTFFPTGQVAVWAPVPWTLTISNWLIIALVHQETQVAAKVWLVQLQPLSAVGKADLSVSGDVVWAFFNPQESRNDSIGQEEFVRTENWLSVPLKATKWKNISFITWNHIWNLFFYFRQFHQESDIFNGTVDMCYTYMNFQ